MHRHENAAIYSIILLAILCSFRCYL